MTVLPRSYPVIKGEDAKRFLDRQRENKRKLTEKVKAKLQGK